MEAEKIKKLLALLLVFLMGTAGFAESQDIELSPYLGRPLEELYNDIGGDIKTYNFEDGITAYIHSMDVTARYTYEDADTKYGWGNDIVFHITIADPGYSLFGIRIGDSVESVIAWCVADGWTETADPPKSNQGRYEKIVDNVRYELRYVIEYDTDYVNCVTVDAEKLAGDSGEGFGWLDWLRNIGD